MPISAERTHFASGPAGLPPSVLQASAAAFLEFNNTGLGLAEHSHRSSPAIAIVDQTKADLAKFLEINTDEWDILLMQGGGNAQFSATAYNAVAAWVARNRDNSESSSADALQQLVDTKLKLDYVVTGRWGEKAAKEAVRLYGKDRVNVVADSKDAEGKWRTIPDESTWKLSESSAMVYYCDNETVEGVEFPHFPEILKGSGRVVVADMSSNILTRRVPWEHLTMVYFGAQKNLGITGVTVVVARKDFVRDSAAVDADTMRQLRLPVTPVMMDYSTMAKNNSLYNTLSIFDVFVAGQMLKHLLATHPTRIAGAESWTNNKAALVYATIEAHPARYLAIADPTARSRTNICFRLVKPDGSVDEQAESEFLKAAEERGMSGLKGYRAIGGVRVGNFSSVSEDGVKRLVSFMAEFAGL
jgi:phosphoserine aminotransferase